MLAGPRQCVAPELPGSSTRALCSLPQGISDGVPLVQAVVPKNQAHSFITQGSPDVLVSALGGMAWLVGWEFGGLSARCVYSPPAGTYRSPSAIRSLYPPGPRARRAADCRFTGPGLRHRAIEGTCLRPRGRSVAKLATGSPGSQPGAFTTIPAFQLPALVRGS